MTLILADVAYFEPWWVQILKAHRDLRRRPADRADRRCSPSASCSAASRAATAPTASGPYGAAPAARRHRQAARQGAVPPDDVDRFLFALAPLISVLTAVAAMAIIPFGDVQDIFGTEVGLYGIDVSIGLLYLFAFGAIAFYGLMLGGWASGSKYSFLGAMRAAAQLISYEVAHGPVAGRRDHHRRHAVAVGDRPGPGAGHVVHRPAVRRLPDLHGRRLRRDQPPAVRPARGRRRARRRLQHRVRRRRASPPTSSPST